MSDIDADSVIDNHDAGRFEMTVDGHLAELRYQLDGERLVLTHTEVPEELEGQGLGGTLVKAALERASRDRLRIVPQCPFARDWLERHRDEVGTVAIDW